MSPCDYIKLPSLEADPATAYGHTETLRSRGSANVNRTPAEEKPTQTLFPETEECSRLEFETVKN